MPSQTISQKAIKFPGHVGNTASQDQSELFFGGMVEAEDLTAADAEIEDTAVIFWNPKWVKDGGWTRDTFRLDTLGVLGV